MHPSVPFVAGAVWDWATLRIDGWLDNGLLLSYFAVLVGLSVVQLRVESGRFVPTWLARFPKALRFGEQFVLGALLSAFWIHVLRALYPGPSALFAAGLFALALANEVYAARFRAGLVRAAMVTFCGFQLLALILPLLTRQLVWSGFPFLGALALTAGMFALVHRGGEGVRPVDAVTDVAMPAAASLSAAVALLAAIQLGLVPALPLVLREGAVARSVGWTDGELVVDPYPVGLLARMGLRTPVIEVDSSEGVSSFTAIYAPSGMELKLLHEWQWLDPESGEWTTSDAIPLEVKGGADSGWRTWSTKKNLRPGRWRVRVVTRYGQELGRLHFAVRADTP